MSKDRPKKEPKPPPPPPDPGEVVTDPMVELLAIKLYEHDQDTWPTRDALLVTPWMLLGRPTRDKYRALASGSRKYR